MRYVVAAVLALLLVGCGQGDQGGEDQGAGLGATCAAIQQVIPPGRDVKPVAGHPEWTRLREGVEAVYAAADPEAAALLEPFVEATRDVTAMEGVPPDVWLVSVQRWMDALTRWRTICLEAGHD